MPQTAIPGRELTVYERYEALPEHQCAQVIDGVLYLLPRPATPHGFTSSMLGSAILEAYGRKPGDPEHRPGGWWILFEPELRLGKDILIPDLAGWRRERMPAIPRGPFITLPPDWLCEILSPSTGLLDRGRKMRKYAKSGVAHLWIVDPLERSVEVYQLDTDRGLYTLLGVWGADERVRMEPFEALELELAEYFLPPEPPVDRPDMVSEEGAEYVSG